MKLIYNSFIPFKGFIAMSIFPFGVFVRRMPGSTKEVSKRTINHESIHWEQQKELGGVLFYLIYVIEWLLKTLLYGRLAYYNISFEREAYTNQSKYSYLKKRKHYAWIKRLFA